MSTFPGDLVTTTASTATSINYAGQSQRIDDGKLVPWGPIRLFGNQIAQPFQILFGECKLPSLFHSGNWGAQGA